MTDSPAPATTFPNTITENPERTNPMTEFNVTPDGLATPRQRRGVSETTLAAQAETPGAANADSTTTPETPAEANREYVMDHRINVEQVQAPSRVHWDVWQLDRGPVQGETEGLYATLPGSEAIYTRATSSSRWLRLADAQPATGDTRVTLEALGIVYRWQRRANDLHLRAAKLNDEVARVRSESAEALRAQQRSFDDWKVKATGIAHRYADDAGLCSQFDDAMREIGLPARKRTYDVTLTVSLEVTVEVEATDEDNALASVDDGHVAMASAIYHLSEDALYEAISEVEGTYASEAADD